MGNLPGEDTKEEVTGPLVDYLRSKDPRLLRVYIIHYAYDRRNQSHLHNPWVLSWYAHGEHQIPGKLPLWIIEQWDAKRTLDWQAVPPEPPAQGSLF
jgi:hypothetical protein